MVDSVLWSRTGRNPLYGFTDHPSVPRADLKLVRLGKLPYVADPRTLQLEHYVTAVLPAPPTSTNRRAKVPAFPMFLNDTLGDCTTAAAFHMDELWSAVAGIEDVLTDAQAQAFYSATGGYVPGDPSTDNGAVIADVMKYWQKTGLVGKKIGPYVETNNSVNSVIDGINLYGAVNVGVLLPKAVQTTGTLWPTPPASAIGSTRKWWQIFGKANYTYVGDWAIESWGGHSVCYVDYDLDKKVFYAASWGEIITVEFGFHNIYCDETWVPFSTEWLTSTGLTIEGFNAAQLIADQKAVVSA